MMYKNYMMCWWPVPESAEVFRIAENTKSIQRELHTGRICFLFLVSNRKLMK